MDEEKKLNEDQSSGEEGQAEDAGDKAKEDADADSSEASQEGSRE